MSQAASKSATLSSAAAYLLAALAMVIYGSTPVVTRAISVDVPPLALTFMRWVIAFVIMLPFVWHRLPSEWTKLKPHFWSLVLLLSCMIGGNAMSVLAVYYTTATNAVLVNASQPAITAIVAWAIVGTRLAPHQRLGIACAFIGIVVMIAKADLGVLLGFNFNVGDLIMLLAVLGWSLYAVLLARRDYELDGTLLMFLMTLAGVVTLLPLYLIEARYVEAFEITRALVAPILYLSIVPTLIATYAWSLSIQAIGPNRTAIFVNLIPISGAALAMIFLGERLFTYHLLGAAFVFAGIYLAVRRR